MTTILFPERTSEATGTPEGNDLWLPLGELDAATGWALKPEGACQGDRCVPIPAGRQAEFTRGGTFNVAALARLLGQPVLHEGATWAFGQEAGARSALAETLEAPDFTLPDLAGNLHSLSDYRGKKVFLASWASW